MKSITKEERFIEAIERMKLLHLSPGCIEAFAKGKVWESEGPHGALYELEPHEQRLIDDIENEKDILVYHMIHGIYEFGECYTMLFVSNDKEEWLDDRQDIIDGYVMTYVFNKSDDILSEFGSISYQSRFGGLVRLY